MAAIKEILEIEQARETAAEWWKIHLFQEGSFFRAYEVSAWLCHTYVSQFKVTHRHVKGVEQSICFIGFPVVSLDKRTPEGFLVETIAEKHIVMVMPQPEKETDTEAMKGEFEEWKASLPLAEPKDSSEEDKHTRKPSEARPAPMSLFSVAQQVLAYPIESHSPIECMLFLSEVKRNIARMI